MLRGVGGDLLVLSLDVAADDDGEHPRAAGDTGDSAVARLEADCGDTGQRFPGRRERCMLATPTRSVAFIRCNLLVGCYLTHTAKESSEGGNFMTNVASYCLG